MHKKIDTLTDILAEIFLAVENNLRAVVLVERIKKTPLAKINDMLDTAGEHANVGVKRAIKSAGTIISREVGDVTDGKTDGKTGYNLILTGLNNESDNNIASVVQSLKTQNITSIRQDIVKATKRGIARMPKIVTQSGRSWGFKEYMEMRVRTDLSHEVGRLQLETGGEAGRVFYICNVFEDSADDHAPFQGKYYYDMRYKSFGFNDETIKLIEDGIRRLKIMPMQYVRENKPYLTTRPNCRHAFTPVSIEQALNISGIEMAKSLGIVTGTYRDSKYQATQQLRLMERNIRKHKFNWKIYNEGIVNATTDDEREAFINLKNKEYAKYRRWQTARKNFVEKHGNLEVDYRREARSKILNDMGVKYNYDELVNEATD